jgi:ABC-type nitrate/sulfonate/bicarbonate transport system permease component
MSRAAAPLAFVAILLAALEALARTGRLSSFVPAPSAVAVALWQGLAGGDLALQAGVTLQTCAIGCVIAIVLAIALGVLMGTVRLVHDALGTTVDLLRPVPSVAMIPLALLLFGLGERMRLAMIVYAAFWPMLVNVLYGVRGVDPVALDVARNFVLSRIERVLRIVLPAALPRIATGIRVSAAIALSVTVTVELVVGDSGIGYAIAQAEQAARIPEMYAAIVLTGILGWLLNEALLRLERSLVFWSPAVQRA